MNQIGFKNFRKFKQLQPKELGDITILVGGNNAGKSTLVKGLLLVLDNIKALRVGGGNPLVQVRPEFRFDANGYHDLGIGTFKRALFNKSKKDEIGFCVRLQRNLELLDDSGNRLKRKADFSIIIYVIGDKDTDDTTGVISRILVWDNSRGVRFDFNYAANSSTIEFVTKKSTSNEMRKKLEQRITLLVKELQQFYEESQAYKTQIIEKQQRLRDAATMDVELNDRQAQLSRENAELAAHMASIDASSPEAIREMEEISARMEELRHQQTELRNQMAHGIGLNLKEELSRLNSLSNSTLMKIADRNAEVDKLKKSLEMFSKDVHEQSASTKVVFGINTFMDNTNGNFIVNQIDSVISFSGMSEVISDEDKENPVLFEAWQNAESDKAFIHERSGLLRELSEDLALTINGISAEYISAHSASQNVVYNIVDKNDYIAKAIHRYCREKIIDGSIAHSFVKKWMKVFEIGDNYKIKSFGGEAYTFQVSEGKEWMELADKGMGSNQMMILLLNLASIIQKYEHSFAKPFVVIEEPEQNLHPALQSRLIELLTEVNQKFGFQFIIETHSEYIVRRAQVFVAQGGYKDDKDAMNNSPYAVYYFPQEGDPYLMQFRKNGKFANEFGAGFFDEAANLAFEIF